MKREKSPPKERKSSRTEAQPKSQDSPQKPERADTLPSPSIRGPRIADPSKL
jgi:hypothetical protein